MLPKKNRTTKKEVEKVFKKGLFLHAQNIYLKFFLDKQSKTKKISFIVPKKVEKTATGRNSLKRLGFNSIKPFISRLPDGFQGVFTFKKADFSKESLKKDIEDVCNKIN